MEATLQRTKPLKKRVKSKLPSSDVSPVGEIKQKSCDSSMKIDEEEKSIKDNVEIRQRESIHICNSEIKLPSTVEVVSVESVPATELTNDIHKNVLPISSTAEKNKSSNICDNVCRDVVMDISLNRTHVNILESTCSEIRMNDNVCVDKKCATVYPSLSSENFLLKSEEEIKHTHSVTETHSLSLVRYPDLKCLQNCEKIHNIISSQILVQTFTNQYQYKVAIEANKGYQDFMKEIYNIDKHPLMDMIHLYHRAKKSCTQLNSRIKYLKSDFNRKRDSLWVTVKKEASAKGKCDDGYSVNVKHIYTIKELDQIKFSEVIKILKEIEEALLSVAFFSYSEELVKLEVEHYICNLMLEERKCENVFKRETFSSSQKSTCGEESDSLKKCISVLFDSQRQNVEDKHYLETCQKWLKMLVSNLNQNANFQNNMFLINHVIRCPNGIENWASQLVQIPIDCCKKKNSSEVFDCICVCGERILLVVYLIMTPVPFKEHFLRHIKNTTTDAVDGKFIVLDSDGEEEDILEMSKNWSEGDVISLLNQIPVRSLFRHFLLDPSDNSEYGMKVERESEDKVLKLFAYSTALIDILCMGLQTYYSENFGSLFETISNLIRHILLYISEYYKHHMNMNTVFKLEIQAVYDKLFFHVVYKIYNFEKLHVLKILPALPYAHISEKMLWNILWIFFHPGKPEVQIYSEKDVEVKIKDECVQSNFFKHIQNFPTEDMLHLLNCIEKLISSNSEDDFVKFATYLLFKITIVEMELKKRFSNDGSVILASVCSIYPYLVSILLKEINQQDDEVANQSINLFKKMSLSLWIPTDEDICIVSSWLLTKLTGDRNHLARLILKKMNFGFNEEKCSLFLPYDLHIKIAVLITEAYLSFDANNSDEGLISKGVKQMLKFTSLGGFEDEREDFAHFAWNILFSLKLHPLDTKCPPLVKVYDGYIEGECEKNISDLTVDFQPLISAYESKHPSGCYLMIVMNNDGYSMENLLKTGLECLESLIEQEQYMAAIKSLYYILPFFVKHSEDLLDKFGFLKAMHSLITADSTFISNIKREPVIGAVIHRVAAMMKFQIYQAGQQTIEFSVPLLKLWIKIFMKMLFPSDKNSYMLKNSAQQIYFLLDLLVKISFLHDYTRICTLDLLDNYCVCSPHLLPKSPEPSILKRLFFSDVSVYPILQQNTLPEYPYLAWYVLLSEIKQKNVQDLFLKFEAEMLKHNEGSPATCLKKVSDASLEFLPIYRFAFQAVETPVSHPVSPLIYQQFFLYYFSRVSSPNSESFMRIGKKFFLKSGPLTVLFRKIKKHIGDTVNYYKNLLKLPDKGSEHVESPDNSKNNKCDNGVKNTQKMLHLNLLKLFEAFQLWIDDQSLLDSRLCLSALEPKYYPSRLELILNGDENVWSDLVSVITLKDEIDLKVHPYCFKKTVNDVKEPKHVDEETLSKQITRHVNDYETVLPPVSSELTIPPHAPIAYEENNAAVSFSKEAIVQLIEQNQSIIFDKAKFFCEQMKKLKQLNFNFINLTPQEYKVESLEINEVKVCYKGHGANGCSGPAVFRLEIQKYKRDERIAERLDNNRADYLIVHDHVSKLPLKDLCIASLKIESAIRSLARKMRQAENIGNADYFRKMGINLFYHQISTIDKTLASVADYPPSRQFFSSIIESLGEAFIDKDETEMMELAKCILKHPESGSLALPLFNPNKSSVLNFLNIYETLTSSITQECSNSLLALFSKIDFSQWLNENAPSFDDRKKLFKSICQALLLCGSSPVPELLPIFEIIKKHFRIILTYMFPDLFPDTVFLLLNGIEDQNLSLDVYYEAFHCFGCPLFHDKTSVNDIEFTLRKFAENQNLPADQQIFISVAQLNLQQVKQVSHLLYNHFMKRRLSKKQFLYKHYSSYVKPIGIFFAIISHSLVSLHLDEVTSLNKALCVSDLWDIFHITFLPWIHPTENTCGLTFPWGDADLNQASYMFKIFVVCFKYFHEKILSYECEESVLSYLWNFYIEVYVVPGYRHYSLSVCHSELLTLPWHQFHPSTQDIEGMCKVLQSKLHESKEFLSKISLKIPWCDVMEKISTRKPPDYVAKVLATLGKLLIISHTHTELKCSKEIENNSCTVIFKEFESLSWFFLSIEDVEALLNLFYDNLDPIQLFNNFHNSSEFYVLKFLKMICCIVPNHDAKEYSNTKRILYLQKFFSTLSTCCNSKTTDVVQKSVKELKAILLGLLSEIEDVICNGVNANEQINYALPLMKEFIIYLNSLPDGELGIAVVDTFISYLSANKQSPLLLPFLKVSSCDLQSVSHMVLLIECCIATRFVDESSDPYETHSKWQLISSYFYVPSRVSEDFIKKCVKENAYLTLFCFVLHKLPHCDSTEKKKQMLQRILQWIRESKLSPNAEAKFLLLWDKLLEISIKLVLEEEHQVVKQELMSFCWILDILAEDKSNSGFFAVIGFGQASSLSVNFRFLCRVMAAFIQNQMPDNSPIRMEPTHVGLSACHSSYINGKENKSSNVCNPPTSVSALKALDNVKALEQKKLYSALQSQIGYAVQCISNASYTLMQSRELLKYFAVILYPKDSYLAALDS